MTFIFRAKRAKISAEGRDLSERREFLHANALFPIKKKSAHTEVTQQKSYQKCKVYKFQVMCQNHPHVVVTQQKFDKKCKVPHSFKVMWQKWLSAYKFPSGSTDTTKK